MKKGGIPLKPLRKWVALGLALLLAGCAPKGPASTVTPIQLMPAPAHVLQCQVNTLLGLDVVEQADRFADRVAQISGGKLLLNVTTGVMDQSAPSQGDCDLAFLSNIQMAQLAPTFAMFALPFIYDDYRHMSLALNGEAISLRLGDQLEPAGVRPLAAIYNGSSLLVSTRRDLHQAEDFMDLVIAMRTDNADKLAIFELLGADVLPYTQPSVAGLMGTQVEILPEDLTQPSEYVVIDTVEVDVDQALEIPVEPEDLYVAFTYHTLSPLWLVMNQESWEKLTDFEKAVLQEGAAGLIAGIEEQVTNHEAEVADGLELAGASIDGGDNPDRQQIDRRQIAEWIYGPDGKGTRLYLPPIYLDPKLYTLIQEIE